jgi:hypothetical protein
LSLSFPTHMWTTQRGNVRQSWFAFSPVGSARLIPITGSASTLTGGGAVSIGATGQMDIEFDATQPGTDPSGSDTVYPGTLYFSVSPSIAATMGGPLKAAIFKNSTYSSWTWGGDYRAGFEFKGQKPISLGITGTFSGKGLTSSTTGFSISLSKMFGGTL